MSDKKMGRPPSNNPLSERIYIRVDKATKEKLDNCTKRLNITRSEIVRIGIDKVYDDLNQK